MSVKDYPAQPGRFGYVVLKAVKPDEYVIVRDCMFCGQESRVKVPAQGLWDWEHGKFIQTAMPNLSADEREQVITGTHPACWDEHMKDPDEEGEG
jgi:hypothetical protein